MKEKIFAALESMGSLDSTEITKEHKLMDDLKLDSLDTMELVLNIEDEFNIQIEESEIENIVTVGNLIDLVGKKTTIK